MTTRQTPDAVREALRYQQMGSRGRCDFNQLREAVAEAVIGDRKAGAPFSPDFRYGHQTVPGINYNSLDRIVTAFVDAALDSRAGDAGEGKAYRCRGCGWRGSDSIAVGHRQNGCDLELMVHDPIATPASAVDAVPAGEVKQ